MLIKRYSFIMACVYNFCFLMSLRLGAILIAAISFLQAITMISIFGIALHNAEAFGETIAQWTSDTDMFWSGLFDSIKATQASTLIIDCRKAPWPQADEMLNIACAYLLSEPEKFALAAVVISTIYSAACLMLAYGAYTFNNCLIYPYNMLELFRQMILATVLVTALMLVKENSLDIGLLIGASVGGGFSLLALFYMWICTVSLTQIIGDLEKEERFGTITSVASAFPKNQLPFIHQRHLMAYNDEDENAQNYENQYNNAGYNSEYQYANTSLGNNNSTNKNLRINNLSSVINKRVTPYDEYHNGLHRY